MELIKPASRSMEVIQLYTDHRGFMDRLRKSAEQAHKDGDPGVVATKMPGRAQWSNCVIRFDKTDHVPRWDKSLESLAKKEYARDYDFVIGDSRYRYYGVFVLHDGDNEGEYVCALDYVDKLN